MSLHSLHTCAYLAGLAPPLGKTILGVIVHPTARSLSMVVDTQNMEQLATTGVTDHINEYTAEIVTAQPTFFLSPVACVVVLNTYQNKFTTSNKLCASI